MYRFVKGVLEGIPDLAPKGGKSSVIPIAGLVTELDAPFCIASSIGRTEERTLDGYLMWTDERFELAFEAETIDQCISIAEAAEAAFDAIIGYDTPDGKHVSCVECTYPKGDGISDSTFLMVRPMTIMVRWWHNN